MDVNCNGGEKREIMGSGQKVDESNFGCVKGKFFILTGLKRIGEYEGEKGKDNGFVLLLMGFKRIGEDEGKDEIEGNGFEEDGRGGRRQEISR